MKYIIENKVILTMWKFKQAAFKLRQKWMGAIIFISESKSLGIIMKC